MIKMFLMCVSIFNCQSNQVPRFFTSLTGVVVLSLTGKESILTFASRCPMMMNSVLSSSSLSLSDSIQSLIEQYIFACSPELLIAPH